MNLDYREIIRAEFLKRRNEKPFYSLRSFAEDLDLTTPHLSKLFKGHRGLSKNSAYRVARRMGLNNKGARYFQALVSSQSGRGWIERGEARTYLRGKNSTPVKSELEKKSLHNLNPLPPIIKKHRSRSW